MKFCQLWLKFSSDERVWFISNWASYFLFRLNNKCYHSWNNFIPDEQKILLSKLKDIEFKIEQVTFYSGWTQNFTILNNFIPVEQKILPSKLKDVEFKIGQFTFYSGGTKNVTIPNNFIPDEQKLLPSELILFRINKKFYHPN